jgi:hypothetical protein
MTIPGQMISPRALELLRLLMTAAENPAVMQSARGMAEHELPWAGALSNGKMVFNGTRETVPGLGTGKLADALLSASPEMRQAYHDAAGDVPTWQAIGRQSAPSLQGTGSFRKTPSSPWETNPLSVNRPFVETALTKPNLRAKIPGNEITLKQGELPLAKKMEALAGFADMQNGAAGHVMLPGGGSGFSALPRGTTPDEMKALLSTYAPAGYSPVDTGKGVSLMNFGEDSEAALMSKLPKLNAQMQQMIPEASAIVPTHFQKTIPQGMGYFDAGKANPESAVYTDFSREFSEGNQGNRSASNKLADMFSGKESKDIVKKLNQSDALSQSMLDRNARDEEFASLLGVKNRRDITLVRKIIGEDGFKAFMKAVQDGKIALPAATAMITKVVDQYGGSEGVDTNE